MVIYKFAPVMRLRQQLVEVCNTLCSVLYVLLARCVPYRIIITVVHVHDQVSVTERGQHLVSCLGELHLEQCLKDLKEQYAGVEVRYTQR